jgi:catechol 2,3-dioxygenase-like lactoylglutathione lyase family enzyme
MKICAISAVTLIVENMERSCRFYSQIPGFRIVYGGSPDDMFTITIWMEIAKRR